MTFKFDIENCKNTIKDYLTYFLQTLWADERVSDVPTNTQWLPVKVMPRLYLRYHHFQQVIHITHGSCKNNLESTPGRGQLAQAQN